MVWKLAVSFLGVACPYSLNRECAAAWPMCVPTEVGVMGSVWLQGPWQWKWQNIYIPQEVGAAGDVQLFDPHWW